MQMPSLPTVQMVMSTYFIIKFLFFYGLVSAQAKNDGLSDRYLLLSIIYTAGIALLSFVFVMSPRQAPDWTLWQMWLGKTFLISTFYFWLMSRFSDGDLFIFAVLLAAGMGVVLF